MTRVLALFGAFLLVLSAWAPPAEAKRVALVIGNSAYEHASKLPNPKNDADAISKSLNDLGFDVVRGNDLNHRAFADTVSDFRKKLKGADVGLFFYAGHGLQVNGNNYLAPTDARLDDETALGFEVVPLRIILQLMERETKINLVFLDACRDNPLTRNLARSMGTRSTVIGQGLAREETGVGTFIAFATQPGNVALDGQGDNSPFAAGMLKHIKTPGLDVDLVMRRVREEVIRTTNGSQVPWTNSSLTGTFIFNDKPKEKPAATAAKGKDAPSAVNPLAVELAFWQAAKDAGTREAYNAYVKKYPDGNFAPLVATLLAEIDQAEAEDAARAAQLQAAKKKQAEADRAKRNAEARQRAQREAAAKKKAAEEAARYKAEAEQSRRELAELQKKQAEEQDRIAREREEISARLKLLEAQAKIKAEAKQVQAQEVRVASLQPAVPAPELDRRTMTLVLQNELKRVGCDPGMVDGKWGRRGQTALGNFNKYASLNLATTVPSLEAIEAVKGRSDRVCPLICGAQYNKVNDQCVKKTCAAGLRLNSRGQCVRPVARAQRKSTSTARKKTSSTEKKSGPTTCLGISIGGLTTSRCN